MSILIERVVTKIQRALTTEFNIPEDLRIQEICVGSLISNPYPIRAIPVTEGTIIAYKEVVMPAGKYKVLKDKTKMFPVEYIENGEKVIDDNSYISYCYVVLGAEKNEEEQFALFDPRSSKR